MDQILSDGKTLPSASGRFVVARDKDQEWGTSGVSDRATPILVACQRLPKFHHCANAAFHRRRQDGLTTLTKRPFAELPLQCLESVGKLGSPYQSHGMQQHHCSTGPLLQIPLAN